MKIILLILLPIFLNAQFTNLKPAPTIENCGCNKVVAYKTTEKSQINGEAIVYRDQITFTFGTTLKTFWLIEHEYYLDDKKNTYKLYHQDGMYFFLINKTYYNFEL